MNNRYIITKGPFSSAAIVDDPHRRSKVDYMNRTPFEQTLYLDTDTAVNADITDIFSILERFDIALCHAHHRNSEFSTTLWREKLPQAFPQFNSGVILYRKTPVVLKFLEDWRNSFRESKHRHDDSRQ